MDFLGKIARKCTESVNANRNLHSWGGRKLHEPNLGYMLARRIFCGAALMGICRAVVLT
jgi:hypothetical protein